MNNQRIYQNVVALGFAGFALFLTTSGALAFSASFAWCSGSPSFALTDVPQDTAKLRFTMTDLNVPSFHHGGGTIDIAGRRRCRAVRLRKASSVLRHRPAKSTPTSSLSRRLAQTARRSRRQPRGANFRNKRVA